MPAGACPLWASRGTAATVRPQTQAQYLSFPPTQMDGCPVHRARETEGEGVNS
jgi:hypothetical protein